MPNQRGIEKSKHNETFTKNYGNNYKVFDMYLGDLLFDEMFKPGRKQATRHTVSHGKDFLYGTQIHSIRLFLVLHILFLLEEQKDK